MIHASSRAVCVTTPPRRSDDCFVLRALGPLRARCAPCCCCRTCTLMVGAACGKARVGIGLKRAPPPQPQHVPPCCDVSWECKRTPTHPLPPHGQHRPTPQVPPLSFPSTRFTPVVPFLNKNTHHPPLGGLYVRVARLKTRGVDLMPVLVVALCSGCVCKRGCKHTGAAKGAKRFLSPSVKKVKPHNNPPETPRATTSQPTGPRGRRVLATPLSVRSPTPK